MGKVLMSYLFSFSRYQIESVIKFLPRQLITSCTLRFFFGHPLKQWPTRRKRGENGNTKIWISWNEKSFFDEIKSIFHSFWRAIIWQKNKNLIKNSGHKLWKLFFVTKKLIKKQTSSAWNFLQPPIPVWRSAYIPYFKISASILWCPLFSENYLNPQVRVNKMVNKHTIDILLTY